MMKTALRKCMIVILGMLLFAVILGPVAPTAAFAASETLEITGDGVADPTILTREELEKMEQHQEVYSSINTWPTKKWYVGKGVRLWDLLQRAGIKEGEAKLLKFTAADGYTLSLTMKELFQDKRYRFPNFKGAGDSDGHLPGDPADKTEVEAIVGLLSVEGSDNPDYMNKLNSLLLMLGQRTVTEQAGNLFVKYLSKIEVLTGEPEKWDAPQANPGSGVVAPGTMVTLSNRNNDDDKIYYTLDGTTPTMNSPMYNWIAKRWWPSRADVLGMINHPIGPIGKNTIIKAITIGPGKKDSDVAIFNYRIEGDREETKVEPVKDATEAGEGPQRKIITLAIGRTDSSVNGVSCTLDAAPYLQNKPARTLVPVRFVGEALGAAVSWDSEREAVIISDGEREIVLVLGSANVWVGGVQGTIDCPPAMLPSGRIFVPLRFVGETLGAEVTYDSGSGGIVISR